MQDEAASVRPVLSPVRGEDGWHLLGGVRFGLAIIVVAVHTQSMPDHSEVVANVAKLGAMAAILCFLVISGYSIAHSIAVRPAGFYRRRFLRIYPLYAASVLLGLVPELFEHSLHPHSVKVYAANLVFVQTFFAMPVIGNAVVWTIAVEAALYIATPLLARLPTVALVGVGLVSGIAYARYPSMHLGYYQFLTHGRALLFLGWAWMAGFVYYRLRSHWASAAILLIVVVTLTALNPSFLERGSTPVIVACVAAVTVQGFVVLPAIISRLLWFLGDLSYPLYLFHFQLVHMHVIVWHHRSPWPVIAESLALASAMLVLDYSARDPLKRIVNHFLTSVAGTLCHGERRSAPAAN